MLKTSHILQPFDLSDEHSYQRWREWKLADYPRSAQELLVPVENPLRLGADEHDRILSCCRKTNAAFYELPAEPSSSKEAIRALGHQFGLDRLDMNLRADEDSITSLRAMPEMQGNHYIPYTNRPLNWHTDGYYNRLDEQVCGIVMHCVSEPATGGDNLILDPEIAYILMRDENPGYIAALMQADAMTIPPNIEDGVEIRPQQSGPVFSVHKATGALHMRYTARTRSIEWKDDRNTRLAAGFLTDLVNSDSAYIFKYRLCAGQGIICNNVLHKREAFTDDVEAGKQRLLYRARYHDRVRDTGIDSVVGEYECSG
uniref:Dioxygenase-like protein n=1 Tax=uncultured bacterium ws034A6 TaxID=1131824 RepID=I1X576_9BACT|nr:dioxygenase-like protein [uncultured bacterium ws034A6]